MKLILSKLKNLFELLKKSIKNNRYLYWNLFHPDNLFKFKYANKAEMMTWELIKTKLYFYKSICEIGCFNGRVTLILKDFLKEKTYIGYDLNIIAIGIAKIINYIFNHSKNNFYFSNGLNSSIKDCELFVSVATFIYFTELELKKFIQSLKINKSFKCLITHEFFLNEDISNNNGSKKEGNLYIHSISMIRKSFGKNFSIKTIRTFYSHWENQERISVILIVKRI